MLTTEPNDIHDFWISLETNSPIGLSYQKFIFWTVAQPRLILEEWVGKTTN